MKTMEKVFVSIEDLTGQSIPFQDNKSKFLDHEPFNSAGIGHSQLNELLLTLGYDRMELGFFRYLFGRRFYRKLLRRFCRRDYQVYKARDADVRKRKVWVQEVVFT